jgi:tetratricopeptide (TPR) repeat protein
MAPHDPNVEPLFSNAERDELAHLDYFLERLAVLHDRGLIAAGPYATVLGESQSRRETIERAGRYARCLASARELAATSPADAIRWAEQATGVDQERPEAWKLIVTLLWSQEDDEAAIAWCARAAEHVPELEAEVERMRTQVAPRAKLRLERAQKAQLEQEASARVTLVRAAVQEHRFAEAAAVCREILATTPDHPESLAIAAFALRRLGRLDEAIQIYDQLVRLQPMNTAWSRWADELRSQGLPSDQAAISDPQTDLGSTPTRGAVYLAPERSWSSFTAEFVKEHWQKLILSLAVLLIVVSSTVGAHILLGDLLWSPEGKCTLALAGTLLLAALGTGLERWGASRAGRMMLVTTLIVVPIHFMLAGELRLLLQPPSLRLVFLGALLLVLVAMVRWVSGRLAEPAGARLLTASLLLISAGSAATTRGSTLAWNLQFASFQLAPLVFLATVFAMGTRQWGPSEKQHREFVYTLSGVLGFALFSCLFRAGVYVMRLEAAFYALPAMFGAISVVLAVRRLARYEPDKKRLALIELGGYALSGLAFALAFSSPYASSASFSSNIVAVASLGIALYSVALWNDRHPSFLYLALGGYLAVRVGLWYFVAERFHAIEDAVALSLGYSGQLPKPFRAIVAVPINLALAGLAIWFVKSWKDRRLARHCHYLGLPLSVAACFWSAFEPRAACICLAAYATFFLLAVFVFSAPRLTYLAVAASSGACYFGSTLVPGVTISGQGLLAATMGCACWAVYRLLFRLKAGAEFQRPWFPSAVALIAVALVAETLGVLGATAGIATGSVTFGLITFLAVSMGFERFTPFLAYVVYVSVFELAICATGLATPGRVVHAHQLGTLLLGDCILFLATLEAVQFLKLPFTRLSTRTLHPQRVGAFRSAAGRFAIVATAVADCLALLDIDRGWQSGLVYLVGSTTILLATRVVRRNALVYAGLVQLAAGALDLTWWTTSPAHNDIRLGWVALAATSLGLLLWMTAAVTRRAGLSDFYTRPCLDLAVLMTAVAFIGALDARFLGRESFRLGVLALATNAVVNFLVLLSRRRAELAYAAVFHVVTATYLVLFSTGNNDPAMAYVLGLTAVAEALLLWSVGIWCRRSGRPVALQCAGPLCHWAVFLTALAVVLCARSPLTLALVAVSLLLAIKGLPRAEWLYGTVAAFTVAGYWRWLERFGTVPLVEVALLVAFGLWGLAVLAQSYKPVICRRLGLVLLSYEFPLFHSAMAAGAMALLLRVNLSLSGSAAWTAYSWLPLGLSLLCVLMVRACPSLSCVHAGLLFLTWSIVGLIDPSLRSPCLISIAGAGLALGLLMIERTFRPIESALCNSVRLDGLEFSRVIRGWAWWLAGLSACLAMIVVLVQLPTAVVGSQAAALAVTSSEWWAMLGALGLLGAFVVRSGQDSDGFGRFEAADFVIAFHWVLIFVVWWLGVAASPIMRSGLNSQIFYPLATGMAALAAAQLARRFAPAEGWSDLPWLPDLGSDRLSRLLSIQACVLAIAAVIFTRSETSSTTVATAILAALAFGAVALRTGWMAAAFAGGLTSEAAWAVLGGVVAARLGRIGPEPTLIYVAVSVVIAAFVLWKLAGTLRSDAPNSKRRFAGPSWPNDVIPIRLALPVECAAFAVSIAAATAVLVAGSQAGLLLDWEKAAGVAVLMAVAVLLVLLVPRWQGEWLVYLAHAMILAAYVDFRMCYRWPIAADAAVLTLLGYIDLGLAEVLDRHDRRLYVRPARFTSLVLAVLPLLQLARVGATNDVTLFHLLAAATFYSVACGQLRWKWLGYAAGVFYNAALWVLWSIFGWKLSDHFQFFMVPVGFSTILFAEAHRGELGRSTVNSIRSAGLLIIYASLAVPIWQFASFGAWLTLLAASLVGVFLGIGLRLQTFLWLGLATFVLDVVYEMGRVSLDHAMAKWAIMLALGLCLVLFVALNEKRRIVETMRLYYEQTRLWE